MKKEWKKPQLVVVIRGSAEENVLDSCKIAGTAGPVSLQIYCIDNKDESCALCEAYVNS